MDNQIPTTEDTIVFTTQEKESLRHILVAHMHMHPIKTWSWRMLFSVKSFALSVLGLVALCSGVSYASQSTLPGDLLYPVKVEVAENVQGALKFSDDDKLAWESEKLDRRLAEEDALLGNALDNADEQEQQSEKQKNNEEQKSQDEQIQDNQSDDQALQDEADAVGKEQEQEINNETNVEF